MLPGGLYRSQSGVYNEEKWGDYNLLKSSDITVNTNGNMPVLENSTAKDIDLMLEQDFVRTFQTLRQHTKDIQQQMVSKSSILSRLKQKLKSHNILDDY